MQPTLLSSMVYRAARCAVAVAVLASAALGLAPLPAADAAPANATVTVVVRGPGDVRVSWNYTSQAKQRDRVVSIERKVGDAAFTALMTRTAAPLRGNYVDRDVPARVATYRIAVADPTGTSTSPAVATDTYTPLPENVRPCPAGWEEEALLYVNQLRQQLHGRPPLVADLRLMRATNERAGKHAAAGRGTHAGYRQDARRHGFTAPVGENIGAGGDPTSSVDGWMDSPGHRATLMAGISVAGVGCAISDVGCCPGTAYWVFMTYRDPLVLWPS